MLLAVGDEVVKEGLLAADMIVIRKVIVHDHLLCLFATLHIFVRIKL